VSWNLAWDGRRGAGRWEVSGNRSGSGTGTPAEAAGCHREPRYLVVELEVPVVETVCEEDETGLVVDRSVSSMKPFAPPITRREMKAVPSYCGIDEVVSGSEGGALLRRGGDQRCIGRMRTTPVFSISSVRLPHLDLEREPRAVFALRCRWRSRTTWRLAQFFLDELRPWIRQGCPGRDSTPCRRNDWSLINIPQPLGSAASWCELQAYFFKGLTWSSVRYFARCPLSGSPEPHVSNRL